MQITVEEIRSIYSKPGAKKKWELVVLKAKGQEFTTFDAAIKEVGVGGVLDFEIEFTPDGKMNVAEGWTIVSKGNQTPESVKLETAMTPEAWAEKDRLERTSIETSTAYKGVIDLLVAGIILPNGEIAAEALNWASAHFKATIPNNTPSKPSPQPTKSKSEPLKEESGSIPQFNNVGQFLTACYNDLGLSRADVLKKLGLKEGDDLSKLNLEEAWEVIKNG